MIKIVLFLTFAFSSTFAFNNTDEFINEINSKQNSWTAGRNFDKNVNSIQYYLGAKQLPDAVLRQIPVVKHENVGAIPESFDARTQWSKCKSISEIPDQSNCGSCWAVSVASSMSDRICIHSDQKLQTQISARNLLACSMHDGCHGGYSYSAWRYWTTTGLVTGGVYGSNIGCQPYSFKPCEHHTDGNKPACSTLKYDTPPCVQTCDNNSTTYANDIVKGSSVYKLDGIEEEIQADIMKNGPIVASFVVYEDFIHYKSGVYSHTTGQFEGRHAVRVIGWGVENGHKYWLVANSWNEDWGDKGLFKILRFANKCSFESGMTAGLPK